MDSVFILVVPTSLSDLLSDTEPNRSLLKSIKKNKYQRFNTLQNFWMIVKRLEEQEKVLKEEIRRMDRMEKRQDMSIEYLKNVVLKFLESSAGEREVREEI